MVIVAHNVRVCGYFFRKTKFFSLLVEIFFRNKKPQTFKVLKTLKVLIQRINNCR